MSIKTKKPIKQNQTDIVASLQEKITRSKAFFVTDYRGITHQQLEHLRRALKKVKAEFVVAKNTLMKIALNSKQEIPPQRDPASGGTINKEDKDKIISELNNPTATLFAYGDAIGAIKELANFVKNVQLPKVKIGLWDGQLILSDDFARLSTLPSRDQLIATLAVRLKSPIYGLHYALSWNLRKLVTVLGNVKNKKG